MKRISILGAALAFAATVTGMSRADTPPVPFPSASVSQVFVAAATVAADGSTHNIFAPGGTVIFRAYAVDLKTGKPLATKDVKYFYVTIPNQPNVKLKFNSTAPGATQQMAWTGIWNIPASYATGLVPFKMLVKTTTKRKGQFVQMPVSAAMLTINAHPPADPTAAVSGPTTAAPDKLDLSLYVDTVAGTRTAAGVAKRIIGCTQTNVFKRGEDIVLRAWGVDTKTGATLSLENVTAATATIAGANPITLNYGAHGSIGSKVLFWSAGWIVPADYPLGVTVIHVTFTVGGKSGSFDYPVNIIP
jgi:hypothetical protein